MVRDWGDSSMVRALCFFFFFRGLQFSYQPPCQAYNHLIATLGPGNQKSSHISHLSSSLPHPHPRRQDLSKGMRGQGATCPSPVHWVFYSLLVAVLKHPDNEQLRGKGMFVFHF